MQRWRRSTQGTNKHLARRNRVKNREVEFQKQRGPVRPDAGVLARVLRTKQAAHSADSAESGLDARARISEFERPLTPATHSMKRQRLVMMAHVLEVGLFLVISAEFRAVKLARGRAPCIEMLLKWLPTVGASTGRILDREAVDYNHHLHRARQGICSF